MRKEKIMEGKKMEEESFRKEQIEEQRLEEYNKIISVIEGKDPRNIITLALLNRSNYYLRIKDFDKAIEDLEKIIVIEPELGEPYNNPGRIYAEKGDNEKTIEYYDKAIERDHKKMFIKLMDRFYEEWLDRKSKKISSAEYDKEKLLMKMQEQEGQK